VDWAVQPVRRAVVGTRLERPARWLLHRPAPARSWVDRRNGQYDAMTVTLIRRVVRADSTTVDAGANHGAILRELARAAPKGTHHAFEPIPELARRLHKVRGAVVHQVALADYSGEATFHYLPGSDAESSLYDRPERTEGQQVVELTVPVRPLDDVLGPHERVDFIKIDVEGAQAALLRGAMATLRRDRPVVVMECHVDELPEAADLLAAADLDIWLIEDYLAGIRRPRHQVEQIARDNGEWYFVGAPAGTATARP
jgi:FkbM family methyltransferase